jgi:O-antigen/teichoic acid export membrane protein
VSVRGARVSLPRAMAWFAGSYAFSMLGYLAVNVLAARLLGSSHFGTYVVIVTATTLVGQLGLVGVNRAGLREAARLDLGDVEGLRGLRRDLRAVTSTSLPLVAIAAGVVCAVVRPGHADRVVVAVSVVALVLAAGHQRACADFLRGWGDVRAASLLEGRSGGALVFLAQAVALSLVLALAPDAGLGPVVAAAAAGAAAPVVWARFRMRRVWGHVKAPVRPLVDLARVARRDWRFGVNQAGTYINAHLELWLAGVLLAATATSLLSAALRLAILLVIPANALQVVFAPAVSRLLHAGDRRRTESLLRAGSTVAAAMTALALVPILLFPAHVLRLVYGPQFTAASDLLMVLTIGFVVNVGVGLCGTALIMGHHEGVVAAVQWTTVIVRLAAGVAGAYFLGPLGLAVSAAVVTAAMQAAMWALVRGRMGMSTHVTVRPKLSLLRKTAS